MFFSGIFHLILLDSSWPEVMETAEREIADKGGTNYCTCSVFPKEGVEKASDLIAPLECPTLQCQIIS